MSVIYLKPLSNMFWLFQFCCTDGRAISQKCNTQFNPVLMAIKDLFYVDKKSMVQYTNQLHLKHPVGIMLRITFKTSVKIMRTDKQQKTY